MTLPIKGTLFEIVRADFIGATDDGIAFEGVLVPVVPCEHGNTGRHIIEDSVTAALMLPNPADAIAWCEGVGDNDAQ